MTSSAPLPLTLIVAYARNRVIGHQNTIPWHLPPDLAHFKQTTLGHPIIMGRRTWESLPRALPGRLNVVISRNPDYVAAGAEVVDSLQAAQALCVARDYPQAFVIGGEQVYGLAMPLAQRVIATEIDVDVAGDAFFPELTPEWEKVEHQPQPRHGELDYAYAVFERRAG